jgi:hypothetical protein
VCGLAFEIACLAIWLIYRGVTGSAIRSKGTFGQYLDYGDVEPPQNATRKVLSGTKPNSSSSRSALDWSVLEFTLKDLMTCPDTPFEVHDMANPAIVFSTERPFRTMSVERLIDHGRLTEEWAKLPAAQFERAREAAKNLVSRQDDRDDLARFAPKDQRIVVWGPTRAQAEREVRTDRLPPQIFLATTPGFSGDRQLAIARVYFDWSIHSGLGTYVLVKRNGEWAVLIRKFVYFL